MQVVLCLPNDSCLRNGVSITPMMAESGIESGIRSLHLQSANKSSSRQWTTLKEHGPNPKRVAQHGTQSEFRVNSTQTLNSLNPATQSTVLLSRSMSPSPAAVKVQGQDIVRNVAVARRHKNRNNLQCFISQRCYAVVLVGTPAVVWRSAPHQLLLLVRPNRKWHGWTSRDPEFLRWKGW